MITTNLSTLKIHKLTQAQYDNAVASGTIDGNPLYLTPDEESNSPSAYPANGVKDGYWYYRTQVGYTG